MFSDSRRFDLETSVAPSNSLSDFLGGFDAPEMTNADVALLYCKEQSNLRLYSILALQFFQNKTNFPASSLQNVITDIVLQSLKVS